MIDNLNIEKKGGSGAVNHNDLLNRDVAGNHALLIPLSDSTTAVRITKANGTTNVFVIDTTNNRVYIPSKIDIGVLDQFSRQAINFIATNSVIKMGSFTQDGDPSNISSEGLIVVGTNSNGVFDGLNWAFARIKSTRIGINNCINNLQFYLFRADETGMYLKDDAGNKTFDVVRSTGATTIKKSLDVYDSSAGELLTAKVKNIVEGTLTNFAEITIANNTATNAIFNYCVEAINGTQVKVHSGKLIVIARNQNNVITNDFLHPATLEDDLGVITDSFTVTNGTGKITIGITATSNITPTSFKFYFDTQVFGTNKVTLL